MRTHLIAPLVGLTLSLMPLASLAAEPVVRQQPDWQAVITAQIESLRAGDAASALQLSTRAFQVSYRDEPQLFMDAIVMAGYAPILESRLHGFGDFERTGSKSAAQVVRIVGKDWLVYNVVYDLIEEPDGWRIKNVVVMDQAGVYI